MINVTIFALPLSSTFITFSGLTGVTLFAFIYQIQKVKDDPNTHLEKDLNIYEIVKPSWLIEEGFVWLFSPIISVALTYLL